MKLVNILNQALENKKLIITCNLNGKKKKVVIPKCRVSVNSDKEGYDIIIRDRLSGKSMTLDPDDTIEISET